MIEGSCKGFLGHLGRLASPLLVAAWILARAGGALAVEPDEILKDAALEARARTISAELRCLVCQNQSIDDSNAPLARDLRLLVRERLSSGDSDADVRAFVVARYGDFVLLRPPFNWQTLGLWLSPFVVLVCGALFAWRAVTRRRSAAPVPIGASGLTAEEEAKLGRLLAEAAQLAEKPRT